MIFIDTEFTQFQHPKLLSIGLVHLDGDECYAELDLQTSHGLQCSRESSDFVHAHVLSQWHRIPNSNGSLSFMAQRIYDWLRIQPQNAEGQIVIAADYHGDLSLLSHLVTLTPLWKSHPLELYGLLIYDQVSNPQSDLAHQQEALDQSQQRHLYPHHALADAHALRSSWLARPNSPTFIPSRPQT